MSSNESLTYDLNDASFRAAGGEDGLRRLVDDFYRIMDDLPEAPGVRYFTGNQLQERCAGTDKGEPNANVALYDSCVSYLAGIVDAADALSGWGSQDKPFRSCVPEGIGKEQLRQRWISHAKANPQFLYLPAAWLTFTAIEKAWPCMMD